MKSGMLDTRYSILNTQVSGPKPQALRALCRELEGVFLATLLRQMRQTVWRSDFIPQSSGEDIFRGLFELEIGSRMAQRGGLGVAEALYSQLERSAARQKERLNQPEERMPAQK